MDRFNPDIYNKEYFEKTDAYSKKVRELRNLNPILEQLKPQTILDIGCGHGYLVRNLCSRGYEAIGMDISKDAGFLIPEHFVQHDARIIPYPFQNKEFDLVTAFNFFEHLEEGDIERVGEEMERIGKEVYALICYKPDPMCNAHLTIKPASWWRDKLKGIHIL